MADIGSLISRAAKTAGVPVNLFRSLILQGERSYHGWQRSPAGAFGPAQLMPGTAAGLASRYGINPNTIEGNLLGGAYYLKEQLQQFGGNPRKAVAAYNAGPGNVQKYGGVPPFSETRSYVDRVLGGLGTSGKTVAPVGYADLPSTSTGRRAFGSSFLPPAPSFRMVSPAPPDITSLLDTSLGMIATGRKPTDALAAATPSLLESWMQPSRLVQTAAPPVRVPTGTDPGLGTFSAPAVAPASGMPKLLGPTAHLNQSFMSKVLSAVHAIGGTQIRITSGYRSPEHNRAVGGVSRSNHMFGHAIDGEVLIGGRWVPIGEALKPIASRFGLRSGDQPGFYRGGTDPVHVDDAFNLR